MLLLIAAAAATPAMAAARPCAARDIVVSTDAGDGDFDGMSQSGTWLVLRNKGRAACRMPGLPTVTFYGADARAVPATRRAPAGMHPGPVVLPVAIPAGGSVATGLRWVSGPVYDGNRRVDVQAVGVTIAGRALRTGMRGTIYGEAGRPLTFTQPPLAPRSASGGMATTTRGG